tara:strand:+ start:395 stop:583 length:189 start_codon:yes stop_codon:yes gene_type:complete
MMMSYGDMVAERDATKRGDYGKVCLETFLSSVDYDNTWYSIPTHEDGSEWGYWELVQLYEDE